jgi:hypothetical protein
VRSDERKPRPAVILAQNGASTRTPLILIKCSDNNNNNNGRIWPPERFCCCPWWTSALDWKADDCTLALTNKISCFFTCFRVYQQLQSNPIRSITPTTAHQHIDSYVFPRKHTQLARKSTIVPITLSPMSLEM